VVRKLKLGSLPSDQRRAIAPRQILSLSGGGYRGLFTARVLELMEEMAGGPLRDRFDLIGGTSIGGILAIGIACGVPAATLRREIQSRGPGVFKPRWVSFGGVLSAKCDAKPLRAAVDAILGAQAALAFADLPAPVMVIAIDAATARPRIFRSARLTAHVRDETSVRDAALATSAAPSFFPAHGADNTTYVDGGLIANSPDLALAAEAVRLFGVGLDALNLCAIGTAGSPRDGVVTGGPGKVSWVMKHDLVTLTIDAQARLAEEQVDRLLPSGILRIDGRPRAPIALDDASLRATKTLLGLADEAFEVARAQRGDDLRQILAHRP
jgi:predicted acylesterase/phospholipase RssA